MKKGSSFQKLFSRDFSLPTVEIWMRGECTNPKGWTDEINPFLPYEIAERADSTIHFYYNLQGVDWACDILLKSSKKDNNFIPNIEKNVIGKLSFIRPIYEKEKAITRSTLIRFLREFEDGLPWFEAMQFFTEWMIDEMPQELKGLDIKGLEKLRIETENLLGSSDTVIRKSLERLYPKLSYLSSVITVKELLSGKIPNKVILTKRYKGYFFSDNQLFLTSKSQIAKKLGVNFVEEKITNDKTKELKGSVASKGNVKGFVRILMGHDQIPLLKDREILVSPMTIPDFMPAMKRASAFVTDEGGVLCHAAIIARELGKPCITGTKFATKIFKDGDYVEVNTDLGLVRKM